MKHLVKELCIGSIDVILKIKKEDINKFDRFETCSHLEFRGYTPEYQTYEFICKNFKQHSQFIMIRNSAPFVLKDENKINEFIFQIRKFLSLGQDSLFLII